MVQPSTTRLRYVSAKEPSDIVLFLDKLGVRVQLYSSPVFDGKKWFLWFVPSDAGQDIQSIDLDD